MKKSIIVALSLCMILTAFPAAGIEYSVTGLGYDPDWNAMNMATDINEAGEVAGFRGDTDFPPPSSQGFFWSNGEWTGIGSLLGGIGSYAYGINGSGQVVGNSDSTEGIQAYIWQNGVLTGLGDDPGGVFGSNAVAINDLGIVAGQCSDDLTSWGACFYKDGAWYPMNTFNWGWSMVEDLSEDVDAMGNPRFIGTSLTTGGVYEAFYWDSGSVLMLGDLPGGGWYSRARAMNDLALPKIVGASESSLGTEAALWAHPDPLSITGLGMLPGHTTSEAFDINDREEVVGTSYAGTENRAFIWGEYLGMRDLNTMLDTASQGWTLREARGINNAGQIVGIGQNPAGYPEAYLLDPVGEMDADLDGYIYTQDCDDSDPNSYPGAPETKHDGVDQDCNGYDLTIEVTTAKFNSRKSLLKVEATSAYGAVADLRVVSYGSMTYNSRKDKWSLEATANQDPVTITVSGTEGYVTVYTGDPPCEPAPEICTDGIDNDCDGLIDTADGDCQSACNDNGICETGEDCVTCPGDCDGKLKGKPSSQFCCGNGILEGPEDGGAICDGNY